MNKQDVPGSIDLVFNFQDIFNAWLQGKCTTNYLHKYVNETVVESFIKKLQEMEASHDLSR